MVQVYGARVSIASVALVVGVFTETVPTDASAQIFGGTATSAGTRLYNALVQVNGQQVCGGAIIGQILIATAAHCLTAGTSTVANRVFVGGIKRDASDGTELRIASIKIHEDFELETPTTITRNDIALIKLLDAVPSDARVLDLSTGGSVEASGRTAMATGWGQVSSDIGRSPHLLEVELPVVENAECDLNGLNTNSTHLCAGVGDGKDTCGGDSGGPFVTGNTLIGLVSQGVGEPCGAAPGIYTRISAFSSWIEQNKDLDSEDEKPTDQGRVDPEKPLEVFGAKGSQKLYRFDLRGTSAQVSDLKINLSGGVGDVDLYVRAGTPPSRQVSDCESRNPSSNKETCSFSSVTARTYHLLLVGNEDYQGAQLEIDYVHSGTPQTGSTELTNGQSASFSVPNGLPSGEFFHISVPTKASNLVFRTRGGTGNLDIRTRFGEKPGQRADCVSSDDGNDESCTIPNSIAGIYYVMAHMSPTGGGPITGASLTVSYEPGDADEGGGDGRLSCQANDVCGGEAPGGCFCDLACAENGDCCFDGPC